jgi:transcription termination/antitermination protein NusG
MALAWYIVHTYSGYEQRVKDLLEERVQTQGLKERIPEVFIPMENVVERKKGKTVTTTRKFFPGYILVKISYEKVREEDSPEVKKTKQEINARLWSVVRETPRVTGFVGAKGDPAPLTEEEVERLMKQVQEAKDEPARPRFTFEPGDQVRIADGPFMEFTGVVEAVNEERKTLKIMVTIFGRATPVEVDFLQAEKV